MPDRVRTLIVDDEPIARNGVRRLLAADPEIEVVGEAGDGRTAVSEIRRLRPDLLLLDVQMPEMNGFEVLDAVDPDAIGAVVFVTAYDEFAVRAFEVQALDYVLKPFEDDRFATVLERAKRHVRKERDDDLAGRLAALLDRFDGTGPPSAAQHLSRLMVRTGGRVFFQPVADIDWIEAADYYARIHVAGATHLVRESLASLEERLDPTRFVRVHRSAIVNLDRVREMRPDWRNRPCLVLVTGETVGVSRSRMDALERAMRGAAD